MALAKFRHKYPQGSLVSELIEIDRGTYIVKALVQIDNIILATALAGAATVEAAEDAAKERAIASLFLDHQPDHQPNISPSVGSQSDRASVEAQPPTSLSREPDSASEQTSNHKIVNFSKPQAEAADRDRDSTPETIPSVTLTAVPSPEVELDLSPQVPPINSNPPTETNLFGDTLTAESPAEISTIQNENEVDPASNSISPELEAMDFNEIKQKTDIEIKRLSWTKDRGKEFLMSRYGKRSRLHLTDEQLLEFLHYLEKLPNPVK
jgi:hypothetical protein